MSEWDFGAGFASRIADLVRPLDGISKLLEQNRATMFTNWESALTSYKSVLPPPGLGLPITSLIEQVNSWPIQSIAGQVANSSVMDAVSRIANDLSGIQSGMAQFANTAATAMQGYQHIIDAATLKFNFPSVLDYLPNISDLMEQWREVGDAQAVLEAHGFGFSGHLWTTTFIVTFAKGQPQRTGAAVTTTRLRAVTCGQSFEDELRRLVEDSPVLRRRWKIIASALDAHRHRNYLLAILALLAQLEGIIGDALILKGMAAPIGHKIYCKGADGHLKRNRKGELIELRGVGQLVQNSDFHSYEVLELTVDLLTTSLVSERNAIMHGRRTAYGTAKLSTQLLLLIFVFSSAIAEFIEGLPTT